LNTALLPDELVTRKPRILADLRAGELGYVDFTELVVMADRSCFLDLQSRLRDEGPSLGVVQVRRGEDGLYYLVIPSGVKFEPGKIPPRSGAELQPVASITIGPPRPGSTRES
jgi:hypothetical protein